MGAFLITGGAGFIGRHLSAELLRAGHSVRILDALVEQAHSPGEDLRFSHEVDFIRADMRDVATVRRALQGVDGVFNLAAEVGVGQSMYEIERYVSANGLATAILLQEITAYPVRRVVVASSMSIYGEGLARRANGELACPRGSACKQQTRDIHKYD
jgi:dTDP-L-rhamnose 4-epimerase